MLEERPAERRRRRGRGWSMPSWFWRMRDDRLDRDGYWPDVNLGDCPYYRGTGDRLCGYGCYQEPECMTGRPRRGWPPYRTRALLDRLLGMESTP